MLDLMRRRSSDRRRGERGASAVEYGLLVGGIAVIIFAAVLALGGQVEGLYDLGCRSFPGAVCD